MCVVSMVGDHFNERWNPSRPYTATPTQTWITSGGMTQLERAEFDALKKEVADMKDLLKRAKLYDEQNGEPSCEMESKVELLKKVAALVGVSLDDVFPKP